MKSMEISLVVLFTNLSTIDFTSAMVICFWFKLLCASI